MYMEQSITIRYGSLCICSLASKTQIIETIAIFLIIVIIGNKLISVGVQHKYIIIFLVYQVYYRWSSGEAGLLWWC